MSLLWKVQIKSHQKLGLGVFLSLNVIMIAIAITRVSGIHYHGSFDNSWIYFWQQLESCAAVTMGSMTAFRSVFVANSSNSGKKKISPWQLSFSRERRKNRKRSVEDGDEEDLANLTIPSATLVGMRTFIQNGRTSRAWRPGDDVIRADDESHEMSQLGGK
ncbi:hypothetical protein MMC14_008683 [Varicellaria rhodocarpa]|nr:hypothetical protein [Varicellaria rhodocarpa]